MEKHVRLQKTKSQPEQKRHKLKEREKKNRQTQKHKQQQQVLYVEISLIWDPDETKEAREINAVHNTSHIRVPFCKQKEQNRKKEKPRSKINRQSLKNEQTHKEEKVKYNKQQQKTLILPPYLHS